MLTKQRIENQIAIIEQFMFSGDVEQMQLCSIIWEKLSNYYFVKFEKNEKKEI